MAEKSKRTAYSPEVRAAALAALLAGQSVSQVAKEYNLPKGTVSAWKTRRDASADAATQNPETRANIGEKLVTLLERNIDGLIAASAVMLDKDWIRKQGASELGVFLGITHDKVVRMLEALNHTDDAQPPVDANS